MKRAALLTTTEAKFGDAVRTVGRLVTQGRISRADAADRLWRMAEAHGLVTALGADRVQALIAVEFSPAPSPDGERTVDG